MIWTALGTFAFGLLVLFEVQKCRSAEKKTKRKNPWFLLGTGLLLIDFAGMACTLLLCSDMAMIAMAMAADFDCQVIVFLCLCVFFMIPFPFIRYARGMTSCSVIYLTFYCIKKQDAFL